MNDKSTNDKSTNDKSTNDKWTNDKLMNDKLMNDKLRNLISLWTGLLYLENWGTKQHFKFQKYFNKSNIQRFLKDR